MARASVLTNSHNNHKIPTFKKTRSSLEQGLLTKAHRSNAEYTKQHVRFSSVLTELDQLLCFDPQTSGGLLLSVSPEAAQVIIEKLTPHFPGVAVIGSVLSKNESYVTLE